MKKNIGSYILLSIIFIVTICLIIFLSKGFSRLKNYINTINSSPKAIKDAETKNNNIIKGIKKQRHKKHTNIKINVEYNNVVNINNDNKSKSKNNKYSAPNKRRGRKQKLNKIINNIKTSGEETIKGKSYSIMDLNNNNNYKIQQNNIETLNKNVTKKNSKQKQIININYNDYYYIHIFYI